ncbi:MAG: hypothetical protein PHX24_01400 [Acidithiobacillus sp.]|nr:hypothetical protein [Acidithiobacillus sp.]
MSSQGNGGDDAAGIIFIIILAGLMLFFYKYVIFFFWIPTKIVELWVWSKFHPHYTQNLQHFVDTVTVMKMHWRDAIYVNGQFISIAGHGWMKPVAFIQTGLSLLLAALLWHKVRQHGLKPIGSITELVTLQKKQFPWGFYWLQKPRHRDTMRRPHEVFGRAPVFENTLKILKEQCGRRHIDFDHLSPRLQALYGAFALQNQGKIEEAQAMLRSLAQGTTPAAPASAEKDWNTRQDKIHFERSIFVDALFHARAYNLLPSSWFNWLKIEDRALWMALSSTPPYRKVIKPFRVASEAVGPLSWWVYTQYRQINADRLDTTLETALGSINTLEATLKEVDYVG